LQAIGKTDLGLFYLVGSISIFATIINAVLADGSARFLAYSIGKGNRDEVRKWMNSAIGLHLCLATALAAIGWPIGLYLIEHVLTIPLDRLSDSRLIFGVSLGSTFVAMTSAPFLGMFTAKQRIAEIAVYGTLQALLSMSLAYIVLHYDGDRLVFYSVGMALIVILVQAMPIVRAFMIFDEFRVRFRECCCLDRIKKVLSYSGWVLFGGLGGVLRAHGTALLLNYFFGPGVNAAYGISMQVNSATNQLSAALLGAFSPEIVRSEGSGDRGRMLMLSEKANKFGYLLVAVFAIPLLVEMDAVINLWLDKPPEGCILFCQIVIISFMIERLSGGYQFAASAYGKVMGYQLTLGGSFILSLPFTCLLFKLGFPPASFGVAFIATMSICSVGRVWWMKILLGVPYAQWIRQSAVPCLFITAVTLFASLLVQALMPKSLLRLTVVLTVALLSTSLLTWVFALDSTEKSFFFKNVALIRSKVAGIFG
jgi:O-antigen/teichoic acid export membrane protein